MNRYARVIVDVPMAQPLDYRVAADSAQDAQAPASLSGQDDLQVGSLCVVPVGKRRQVGIIVGFAQHSAVDPARLRPLGARIATPQLSASWLELCRFAAEYYHFPWGEVALPALPPNLRRVPKARAAKARTPAAAAAVPPAAAAPDAAAPAPVVRDTPATAVALRAEQEAAISAIATASGFAPFLLFGITGSGKTEVYLGAIERALALAPGGQALLLVPEINLTPQLQARLRTRFPGRRVLSLHSALAPRDRAQAWMEAHDGHAHIILGTRTAVFASLPRLRLIVVDEEHDPSFKSHGGVPYSARDLAVKRAQIEGLPVVLGSATPSLETWYQARSGRYRLLALSQRGADAKLPARADTMADAQAPAPAGVPADPVIEMIDLQREPAEHGLAPSLRAALQDTLVRGEQALVFINRRGFAPVLRCGACEWLSRCPHCDTFAAYHKVGAALRCHHCGWNTRVPGACPDCGNQDLQGVGQGTQRVEETLRRLLPDARIARIDRDNTQGAQGAHRASAAFDAVHAGAVDILVGTQMITKGHDFRRVTTVGVLNADAQLVAADFRAPERLFAVLMQVAGRAGRAGQPSRVLIQTRYPQHPLFRALARASFSDFAHEQIDERRAARMPPFVHLALLTTAARTMEQALEFLQRCAALRAGLAETAAVTVYDPVPMPLARLAAESRGQLLIEAQRRPDLHAFLGAWLPLLRAQGSRGVLRWSIEVDPQAI